MSIIKKILIIIFLLAHIHTKEKLSFSALSVQGTTVNGQKVEIFKDNVVIKYKNMTLFSDLATHYKDSEKVILENEVKMIDEMDTLVCNSLIIQNDLDNKKYIANGDVALLQKNRIVNSNQLVYWADSKKIQAYQNVMIKDSLREITGDSIFINYKNKKLKEINILSNAKILSKKNIKLEKNEKYQPVYDEILGETMILNFNNNEKLENIDVAGMANTIFNTEKNDILEGQNHVSGDSIKINFNTKKLLINSIVVNGGVIGKFLPEKNNSNITSEVLYNADKIEYNIDSEISILTDNAKIIYDGTELIGGEILTDWGRNIVESKNKNNLIPQIITQDSEPMSGEEMYFDLSTKEGTIKEGFATAEMGIFKGQELFQNNQDDLYITESTFTSCDLDEPHYHFGSNEMLVKKEDKIIARPMVVYIRDFPIVGVPFAILPHSTNNRKSGLLMPSFGHSSNRGTYIKDFGFYLAPNDYMDFDFKIDFYDRKYINLKSKIRYNKLYGKKFYNYKYNGYFSIDKFKIDLIEGQEDIQLLDEKSMTTELRSIRFYHDQSFGPTQNLKIDYTYKSDRLDTNEINIKELLNQNLSSKLSYSKNWDNGSSLIIGINEFKKLNLPNAENLPNGTINYRNNFASLSYNLPTRNIFGIGDKWYNKIYLSYNLNFKSNRNDYYKNAVENIDIDSQTNNFFLEDSLLKTYGGIRQTIDVSLSTNLSGKMEWLNINPSLKIYEDWITQYKIQDDNSSVAKVDEFQRRLIWNAGVNFNTTIYGVFPSKLKNLQSIRHILKPWLRLSYQPDINNFDYFSGTSLGANPSGYFSSNFGLRNNFQIKTGNQENGFNTWDLLKWNLSSSYNFETKYFSNIISDISLSGPPDGNEYFSLYMSHSLYTDDSKTNLIKIDKGELPKLEVLRMSMSRTFNLNISGSNSVIDDEFEKEKKVWESKLGLTLRADYNLNDDWIFKKFLKSMSTIYFSKNWKINLNADFNLDTMDLELLSLKFYRPLHCWEFSFDMNPIGWNKGFLFRLSIIEPGLNDINIRQSNKRVY